MNYFIASCGLFLSFWVVVWQNCHVCSDAIQPLDYGFEKYYHMKNVSSLLQHERVCHLSQNKASHLQVGHPFKSQTTLPIFPGSSISCSSLSIVQVIIDSKKSPPEGEMYSIPRLNIQWLCSAPHGWRGRRPYSTLIRATSPSLLYECAPVLFWNLQSSSQVCPTYEQVTNGDVWKLSNAWPWGWLVSRSEESHPIIYSLCSSGLKGVTAGTAHI